MKIKTPSLFIVLFTIFFAGCNGQTKTEEKNQPQNNTQPAASNNIDIPVPDFRDPGVKKNYQSYNEYLKKVLTAIRKKDEAGTMKLFTEEGKQFEGHEWELKDQSIPEEKQKLDTWVMQSYPYMIEMVQSEYYKKYWKEKIKKMNKK